VEEEDDRGVFRFDHFSAPSLRINAPQQAIQSIQLDENTAHRSTLELHTATWIPS
jgi:hypothetical protein